MFVFIIEFYLLELIILIPDSIVRKYQTDR